jgi:hypothetical protein
LSWPSSLSLQSSSGSPYAMVFVVTKSQFTGFELHLHLLQSSSGSPDAMVLFATILIQIWAPSLPTHYLLAYPQCQWIVKTMYSCTVLSRGWVSVIHRIHMKCYGFLVGKNESIQC